MWLQRAFENNIIYCLSEKQLFGWKNSVSRRVKKNDCEVYWGKWAFIFLTQRRKWSFRPNTVHKITTFYLGFNQKHCLVVLSWLLMQYQQIRCTHFILLTLKGVQFYWQVWTLRDSWKLNCLSRPSYKAGAVSSRKVFSWLFV